ncbi:LysE family translocator [Paraperlucidibaca wandonensis]|jgi:threonine/homoserine/homoserine lactone efflux protein|uniref:LysE family translocator n=1 Tax=Paraperlucidibaca wandonensis TaxID=1268273 RepID=A0ABW3HIJ2_9GAMM
MGTFEAFTLFLVMLPLAAMPSSSVALVVTRSVFFGRASGVVSALGIVAGDLIFVAMALVGVSVLAEWLGALFSVAKYCGGIYLIWLGVGILKSKSSLEFQLASTSKSSYLSDFVAGLFLTLGDVKAILFYASLFPALIDMKQVGLGEVVAISVITIVTVGGVKLIYAIFASRIVESLRHRVSSDLPRKLGGTLMIGCGSVLVTKA